MQRFNASVGFSAFDANILCGEDGDGLPGSQEGEPVFTFRLNGMGTNEYSSEKHPEAQINNALSA
jgi:hypothetical protein